MVHANRGRKSTWTPRVPTLRAEKSALTTHLPLRDAVVRNDPAAVTLALDEGALDGYLRNGVRWSWPAEALRLGHREAARACLAHPRGFLFESQCWSISGLVQGPHDDVEMLEALLAREALVPYRQGGRPLEHLLAESGHARLADALFKTGHLQTGVLDEEGFVPLFRAVRAGDVAMAQVFFDHGAPLNSRIERGDRRGALHLALEATRNREAIMTWLLDRGIDTRLVDDAGRTAAMQAADAGEHALAQLIHDGKARGGPRWHREAVRRGMNDVVCAGYDKANGFCFDPNEVVYPFLIGGDYDGAYPDTPHAALDFVRSLDPKSDLGHRLTSWIPLIERILAGKDVGLREVLALGRRRDKP